MKIVSIFAYRLFAFQYDGEGLNEYDRLMNLWGDGFMGRCCLHI